MSPVPGDDIGSGGALQAALASITTNSATNPWLIKLEPGTYDLGYGGGVLYMKPYVDIEGSGEGVTTIIKSGDGYINEGTVRVADNSELRRLTVVNRGGNAYSIAVNFQSTTNARVNHVTAIARDGSTSTTGINLVSSTAAIEDVVAIGTHNTYYAVGLHAAAGSTVTLRRSRIVAAAGTGDAYALINGQGSMTVLDSDVQATGGGSVVGFYVAGYGNIPMSNGSLIRGSLFSATGGSDAHAIEVAGGAWADIDNSRATGTTSGMRMRTTGSQSGTSTVRSTGSTFVGATGVITTGGGYETYVGGGRIGNSVSGGTYKCSFVVGSSFDALTSTCTP